MTFSTPRNFFYSGGVFDNSWLDWIWFNIAPDIRIEATARTTNAAGSRGNLENGPRTDAELPADGRAS